MPKDLLVELETAAPGTGSLERIEDLLRKVRREVGLVVNGLKGSSLLFEHGWRHIVMEVARGQTTEIHATRPRLVRVFDKRLGLLKQTRELAAWLSELGRWDVPDPDPLSHEIAGMERLKVNVFDRWQTSEDLEDLAARDYPLTKADLDQIGPQRRPPASYYAEESEPF
jgi:hypothetical protein